jgi:putative flavoprotein involved in K+ transport
MPVLADGRVIEVSNVVWCTGFRNDFDWIKVPIAFGEDGFPEQQCGVVPSAPGLYFVGMLFLHSFSSMLVLGAGRDAGQVAKHILSRSGARLGERSGSGASAAQEIAA